MRSLPLAALVHCFHTDGRRQWFSDASPGTIADGSTPPIVQRLVLCGTIGLATTIYVLFFWSKPQPRSSDFAQIWAGARQLLQGIDPYQNIGLGRSLEWDFPLFYPLTAVLVGVPFAFLQLRWADALFVGVGFGTLTWALTTKQLKNPQLLVIVSTAGICMMQTSQWSALLTAAALVPALGWLLMCKPTIGFALWCAYPSRRAIIPGALLILLTVVLRPSWPLEWLATLNSASHIRPLLVQPGGIFALLALFRWRRPEARLLAALVCVPQTAVLYEAVPLFLVPQNFKESCALALLTAGVLMAHLLRGPYESYDASIAASGFWLIWLVYVPCVLMVLMRENVAPVDSGVGRTDNRHTTPAAPSLAFQL